MTSVDVAEAQQGRQEKGTPTRREAQAYPGSPSQPGGISEPKSAVWG